MIALIQLNRAPVRIGHHDPAAPLAILMAMQDLGAYCFQCRHGCLKRGNPQTDEGAPSGTPLSGVTRATGGEHRHVDAAHLACRVDVPVAMILVVQREPKRSVERQGLVQPLGENDDRCQLGHTSILPLTVRPGQTQKPGGTAARALKMEA
jgi:hypothetical protein